MNRRDFLTLAAAPLVLGAAAPAAARRAGGWPLALVTADTRSRVAAVELGSGRVVASVHTPPGPRAVEALRDLSGAVVAHSTEGVVTLLDGLRVRRVVGGFAEPRYMAAHPFADVVYVTDSKRGELVVLDVRRARIVARLDLGGPARHVTVSPDGDRVWTALGSKARELAVVDVSAPFRPRLVRRVAPPWRAHDVAFSPDGEDVWVSSGAAREVAVVPAGRSSPRALLLADAPPQHVAFGRGVAYVASGKDGTLRTHVAAECRLLRSVRIPSGSYNVCASGGWVVTPSLGLGTLTLLDERGRPRERVGVAPAAHDACIVVLP